MISTPFKILLFVLVDGWHLVCQLLVSSFAACSGRSFWESSRSGRFSFCPIDSRRFSSDRCSSFCVSDARGSDRKPDGSTEDGFSDAPDRGLARHLSDIPVAPEMEIVATAQAAALGEYIGMSRDKIDEVKLALVEACINAFEHAHTRDERLHLTFRLGRDEGGGDWLEVEVFDRERASITANVEPPTPEKTLRRANASGGGDCRSYEPDGRRADHVGRLGDADRHEEIQVSDACKVSVERRGDVAILWTDGYINNQGGEEIAREAYAQLDAGARALVLNLEKTRIVNSIGISILIEVLEKVMDRKGVLAFCGLTPTIDKTFRIMGLAQYATIYPTQDEALQAVSPRG